MWVAGASKPSSILNQGDRSFTPTWDLSPLPSPSLPQMLSGVGTLASFEYVYVL